MWRTCYVVLLLQLCTQIHRAAIIEDIVARAIPVMDAALGGAPILTLQSDLKIHCLRECIRYNCLSFNYGEESCELFDTYVCQDVQSLESRAGFKHFDVERGSLVQSADSYRNLEVCTASGRCSPKCYDSETSSTIIPSPTTTVTSTLTTTVVPDTTITTTTTASENDPLPGEVNYQCGNNEDCLTEFSDCRNEVVCECIAGYSYHAETKSCVTSCPSGYGDTFHKTEGHFLYTLDLIVYTSSSRDECKQHCRNTANCLSIDYNTVFNDCILSDATMFGCPSGYGDTFHKTEGHFLYTLNLIVYTSSSRDECKQHCRNTTSCISIDYNIAFNDCILSDVTMFGFSLFWFSDPNYVYYQRNCA